MQQYLRRGRLSALMDGLGLRAALALAAVGWFVYLWGLTVPALLAGGAPDPLPQAARGKAGGGAAPSARG